MFGEKWTGPAGCDTGTTCVACKGRKLLPLVHAGLSRKAAPHAGEGCDVKRRKHVIWDSVGVFEVL